MARRRRRQLVLVLSAEQYDILDRQARASERDAWQQARWYVLRALGGPASADDDPDFDAEPEQKAATG